MYMLFLSFPYEMGIFEYAAFVFTTYIFMLWSSQGSLMTTVVSCVVCVILEIQLPE